MKVLHLFSIEKFVDAHIYNVQPAGFDNTYIFLNNECNYTGRNQEFIKHIIPYSQAYYDLIKSASTYDIIIVYFLSIDKAYLINQLAPSDTKVVWSFYGADLYELPELKYKILSPKTKAVLNISPFEPYERKIKEGIKWLIKLFSKENTNLVEIKKSFQRINYFSWYSLSEYTYLNKKFGNKLPAFLQSTNRVKKSEIVIAKKNEDKILLGNSANPSNNHIDIINLLETHKFKGQVSIPFNYGNSRHYTKKLKAATKDRHLNLVYLDTFMKADQYIDFLNSHTTFVLNSYRQMGLGNVFIAMECGLKVYLSEKNPSYPWLKDLGFHIYSIESQLLSDFYSQNLKMNYDLAKENCELYFSLFSEENGLAFLSRLTNNK